jgi:hypothetical protein
MGAYARAVRGAEAGVIAAAALEVSFFVLDLIRLHPLATPVVLSGALPGPGGVMVDLTNASGIAAGMWATYQVVVLTLIHFVTFGFVGVVVSLMFDWRQPFEAGRVMLLAGLCTVAFFTTVALSGSVVGIGAVGWPAVLATNLLAAVVLGGSLRLVSSDVEGKAPATD